MSIHLIILSEESIALDEKMIALDEKRLHWTKNRDKEKDTPVVPGAAHCKPKYQVQLGSVGNEIRQQHACH
jgi:hypothetical protein